MTIYRGSGGGGNATTDSEIALLTQLEQSSSSSAAAAAASAAAALVSETNAGTAETNAAVSEAAAASSASAAATSASNAATSESNAAASAAAAATFDPANFVEIAGDTMTGNLTVPSLTDSGNLAFTGTGNRITGDFSNATIANRVMFQTSATNGVTNVGALPNGTATIAQFTCFGNADPANTSTALMLNTGFEVSYRSAITGTGSYLPMTFYTGGSERMRINVTSGGVGIGGTNSDALGKLEVNGTGYQAMAVRSTDASGVQAIVAANANQEARFGTVTSHPMAFYTGGSERMRIDTAGNVGIGISPAANRKLDVNSGTGTFAARFTSNAGGASLGAGDSAGILLSHNFSNGSAEANFIYGVPASTGLTFGAWNGTTYTQVAQFGSTGGLQLTSPFGLGYGTGAGGTVTQATSKGTAVTLNRPCGRITMNNAALAAGGVITFGFNNTVIGDNDLVMLQIDDSGAGFSGFNYNAWVYNSSTGFCLVALRNVSGGTLSDAVVINFAIIKGATS